MKLRDITSGIFKRRSPKWKKLRKDFLIRNPACFICGSRLKIEVHHVKMFHLYPELELEESNLITLCEGYEFGFNCHFYFGHYGNFRQCNANLPDKLDYFRDMFTWVKIYK